VTGDQAGVQVDHQTRHRGPGTDQGRDRPARLGPQQPGPFSRHRPGLLQRVQPGRTDPVQDPPRRRCRSHPAEQARLLPQHRQIRDRLTTVGQQHRQIAQHPTRRMRRPPLPSVTSRSVERLRQPGRRRHIGQQPGPDVRHHTPTVRADLNLRILRDTLHSTSAFLVSRS